ncbi:MAG: folate-binding protein YgfZ [Candidatus Binatia bacterium]
MSDARAPSTLDDSYEGAPASRGDAAADWAALDTAAGIVDSRWRRFFPATGEERREFLHGQTTAHVTSLTGGSGAAALVLTAQGKPLAMLALYESGERLWISTTAARSAAARAALSRFLVADDCDFEDDVDACCVTVAGPHAATVLAAAGASAAAALDPWAMGGANIAGQAVLVFSRGDLRVPCFDVLACDEEGRASDGAAVRAAIEAAGAARCGVAAFEILRVESGAARYGVDVDETRLAVEARLEWAIHFNKGCYVGQEVVERAVSRGRINHELCLLKLSGEAAAGSRVDGGNENDVVTSVVRSPRLGTIALAYVPRAKADAGTAVTVLADGASVEAVVLPWPRQRTLTGRPIKKMGSDPI